MLWEPPEFNKCSAWRYRVILRHLRPINHSDVIYKDRRQTREVIPTELSE